MSDPSVRPSPSSPSGLPRVGSSGYGKFGMCPSASFTIFSEDDEGTQFTNLFEAACCDPFLEVVAHLNNRRVRFFQGRLVVLWTGDDFGGDFICQNVYGDANTCNLVTYRLVGSQLEQRGRDIATGQDFADPNWTAPLSDAFSPPNNLQPESVDCYDVLNGLFIVAIRYPLGQLGTTYDATVWQVRDFDTGIIYTEGHGETAFRTYSAQGEPRYSWGLPRSEEEIYLWTYNAPNADPVLGNWIFNGTSWHGSEATVVHNAYPAPQLMNDTRLSMVLNNLSPSSTGHLLYQMGSSESAVSQGDYGRLAVAPTLDATLLDAHSPLIPPEEFTSIGDPTHGQWFTTWGASHSIFCNQVYSLLSWYDLHVLNIDAAWRYDPATSSWAFIDVTVFKPEYYVPTGSQATGTEQLYVVADSTRGDVTGKCSVCGNTGEPGEPACCKNANSDSAVEIGWRGGTISYLPECPIIDAPPGQRDCPGINPPSYGYMSLDATWRFGVPLCPNDCIVEFSVWVGQLNGSGESLACATKYFDLGCGEKIGEMCIPAPTGNDWCLAVAAQARTASGCTASFYDEIGPGCAA